MFRDFPGFPRAAAERFQMQSRLPIRRVAAAAVFFCTLSAAALAAVPVTVAHAWVRATVPGQSVAGAYMDITSSAPAALIGAASPLARKAETHAMMVDAGVMKMRAVQKIELPADVTVNLKPGGLHLMLVDVKRELKPGERVPIKLIVQDRRGAKTILHVDAEVRAAGGGSISHGK